MVPKGCPLPCPLPSFLKDDHPDSQEYIPDHQVNDLRDKSEGEALDQKLFLVAELRVDQKDPYLSVALDCRVEGHFHNLYRYEWFSLSEFRSK